MLKQCGFHVQVIVTENVKDKQNSLNKYINCADYWLCEKLSNAVNMERNNIISLPAKFQLVKAQFMDVKGRLHTK